MSAALTIARRELRGGLRNFRVFLACLALGVAAIATIGSIRAAVTEGLLSEASVILGGDAELKFTYRFATEAERDWMDKNATQVSEIVDFRSMAIIERNGMSESALVQLKAVDEAYPLYGKTEIDPPTALADALTGDLPRAVAAKPLIDQLGLKIGDTFKLGQTTFELAGTLTREPDSTGIGISYGPRVIVRLSDLENSGLLAPGTLFETQYRLAVPPDTNLEAMKTEALDLFRDNGLRWRDRRNGAPGLSRFVERIGSFLVLVGLAGLAVGGIGVSAAIRSYMDKKTETIATLKTLGASSTTIFTAYLVQIGALAALGVALGVIIGATIPLLVGPYVNQIAPVPAIFGLYPLPLIEAAIYGLLTALIFALWPLARARDIRAAGLFRDATGTERQFPARRFIAIVVALTILLIAFAAWRSGIPTLTIWSAIGILLAIALLTVAAYICRKLAAWASRTKTMRGFPTLRLALGSVGASGGETSSVVLSLGLGLSVLAAVGQIDANLRGVIETELPQNAPAYFMVDIQNTQLPDFLETANADGVEKVETAAMLRGILTRINDKPAQEVAGEHWVLRGDRGISYGDTPPKGVEITQGTWWDADYSGPPLVSFAREEGVELGLKLGDEITMNILGRDITAKIANFREVDFRDMGINFIMIVNTAALQGAPHSHIATIYATESAEAPLLRRVAQKFPNVTAVRTRDAIARVAETLKALASATSWGASVTLLTGFIVLIGAAAAGETKRAFEAALLKTLGSTRRRVLISFALRSAILGAVAGLVAIAAGSLAGWAVMTFVMESEYQFEPISAATIVFGGALVSLLAGLYFAIRPLNASPARILRAKE